MTSRRSFLRLLGIGVAAAPAAVVATKALAHEGVPLSQIGIHFEVGNWRAHTHTLASGDGSHTHTITCPRSSEWRPL